MFRGPRSSLNFSVCQKTVTGRVLFSRLLGASACFLILANGAFAQNATPSIASRKTPPEPVLQHRTVSPVNISENTLFAAATADAIAPPILELSVVKGTPIRAELDKSVLVKKVGQPVQAYVTDPVYAFDRVAIPRGSELDGHITQLIHRSAFKKMGSYLNADFSPHRVVRVDFDTLILPSGARLHIRTEVLPDSGPVLKLESHPRQDTLSRRAKEMARSRWHATISEIKPSTLWSRAKFFANSYWPYHKQKIAAGSVFVVELCGAVDFGPASVPATEMGSMGQIPPENTDAFARLVTPLSSATDRVGVPVEAVLTRPIFSPDNKLLFPVNTKLLGIVVRAEPARRLHRNGQLHFKLTRVQLPSSASQQVEMALEGMEVPKASNVQLDSEGATHVASHEKSRVLSTALSVGVASLSLQQDRDHGVVDPAGHTDNRALAGGSGYKLIGFALTLGIKSQPLSHWMGFWGAGQSVYLHFITRGQDLVLPKDTPMEISFGAPRARSISDTAQASSGPPPSASSTGRE
jgi:hypothetical protein